jgi:hypothetical protein
MEKEYKIDDLVMYVGDTLKTGNGEIIIEFGKIYKITSVSIGLVDVWLPIRMNWAVYKKDLIPL